MTKPKPKRWGWDGEKGLRQSLLKAKRVYKVLYGKRRLVTVFPPATADGYERLCRPVLNRLSDRRHNGKDYKSIRVAAIYGEPKKSRKKKGKT